MRVASRFILPQRVLISYEEWKEVFGTMAEGDKRRRDMIRGTNNSSSRGASSCRRATSNITYSKVVFGSEWNLGHDGAWAVGSFLLSA